MRLPPFFTYVEPQDGEKHEMRVCDTFRRSLLLGGLGIVLAQPAAAAPRELLIYVGTTMVPPVTELSRIFERNEGAKISIAQGVSENLYRSAQKNRVGDLYLPGEPGYIERYQAEGLLSEHVTVGYNRLAIVVPKGNPKGLKPDLKSLLRPDLKLMMGAPESSAVGAESKSLLGAAGLFPQALEKSVFLAPDSRSLSAALRNGEVDVVLNWRATAFFPENASAFDLLDLDPKLARPKALQLTLLTLSRNAELARRFMALAISPLGQAIFRRYGFIDSATGPPPGD